MQPCGCQAHHARQQGSRGGRASGESRSSRRAGAPASPRWPAAGSSRAPRSAAVGAAAGGLQVGGQHRAVAHQHGPGQAPWLPVSRCTPGGGRTKCTDCISRLRAAISSSWLNTSTGGCEFSCAQPAGRVSSRTRCTARRRPAACVAYSQAAGVQARNQGRKVRLVHPLVPQHGSQLLPLCRVQLPPPRLMTARTAAAVLPRRRAAPAAAAPAAAASLATGVARATCLAGGRCSTETQVRLGPPKGSQASQPPQRRRHAGILVPPMHTPKLPLVWATGDAPRHKGRRRWGGRRLFFVPCCASVLRCPEPTGLFSRRSRRLALSVPGGSCAQP